MKKISKQHIVAKKQEAHIIFEKKILQAIRCDFIVRLVLLPT